MISHIKGYVPGLPKGCPKMLNLSKLPRLWIILHSYFADLHEDTTRDWSQFACAAMISTLHAAFVETGYHCSADPHFLVEEVTLHVLK